jgi:hypothetical protein
MEKKLWLSIDQATGPLDMTYDQIAYAIRKNKFPFRTVRIGRHIKISARDIGLLDAVQQPEKEDAPARAEAA